MVLVRGPAGDRGQRSGSDRLDQRVVTQRTVVAGGDFVEGPLRLRQLARVHRSDRVTNIAVRPAPNSWRKSTAIAMPTAP